MNKKGLQEKVREALGGTATPQAAALALDAVLKSIQEGLVEDGQVRLAGFGQFKLKTLGARRMPSPHSPEITLIPAHKKISFKAAPHAR